MTKDVGSTSCSDLSEAEVSSVYRSLQPESISNDALHATDEIVSRCGYAVFNLRQAPQSTQVSMFEYSMNTVRRAKDKSVVCGFTDLAGGVHCAIESQSQILRHLPHLPSPSLLFVSCV